MTNTEYKAQAYGDVMHSNIKNLTHRLYGLCHISRVKSLVLISIVIIAGI